MAFFSLLAFIKAKRQIFFVICQITFHFAPNDQLKILTPTLGKGATPLRPIEAQSVVNIAGMKYLVVPHPDPDVIKSKKKNNGVPGKLPIVLKPQGSITDDCPSFEVEETSEGKLTLLPIGKKLTMYNFHDSTDIFVNPSFLPFCTLKAP